MEMKNAYKSQRKYTNVGEPAGSVLSAGSKDMSTPTRRPVSGSASPWRSQYCSVFSDADPLAVVEASLTSVKYAFYQTVGYIVLCAVGCPDTITVISAANKGFIGGAIFTVPYLILLLPPVQGTREQPGSCRERVALLATEMMYSAIAGGVGVVIRDEWSRGLVLMGMARGFVGPFASFTILFASLKILLWAISMCMRNENSHQSS
ncbi:hypothetical protein Hypma_014881 [Hypsizygus marmoreus]|uniref:Uncharacterized protein n=1 Tax=Hypsizygus marmoreus TaxID=39966 RepID=A0A369K3R3_HYPMA|nr:hypothetical protein Hypma_014881 [Hypsizygus marmoreus]